MIKKLKNSWQREEVRSISRRYFISNGFDGTLTAIGVTIGSYLSGVSSGLTVFQIGMGAMIGLATSGVWSVWEIERAEKIAELREVEESMLEDLEDTEIENRKKQGRIINAAMSGLGPVIAVSSIVSPFLFTRFISLFQAAVLSVVIGSALLFVFGVYMGKISKQKWYVAGARMGLAGLVVAALNIILPG